MAAFLQLQLSPARVRAPSQPGHRLLWQKLHHFLPLHEALGNYGLCFGCSSQNHSFFCWWLLWLHFSCNCPQLECWPPPSLYIGCFDKSCITFWLCMKLWLVFWLLWLVWFMLGLASGLLSCLWGGHLWCGLGTSFAVTPRFFSDAPTFLLRLEMFFCLSGALHLRHFRNRSWTRLLLGWIYLWDAGVVMTTASFCLWDV